MPSPQLSAPRPRSRRALPSWVVLCASLLCAGWPRANARAQVAPDATAAGPAATTSAEYKLPASVDPDILAGRTTELWARVYRPATLSAGTHPLIVILHGNHATCGRGSSPRIDDRVDYTSSGTCPLGYVVAPSHAGYGYLADKLASWGYIVVSINANRGINAAAGVSGDSGLNLARGRLILKHLQRLSEWNQNGGTPSTLGVELKGHIDFSHVGLVGHSRGGEGIRAAYNLYRDSGSAWPTKILSRVEFRALFEIGPVDGQTARVLNADGVAWSVLLPMCDGDVSNLQGIRPYDRMMRSTAENPPRQKSALAVWGTNHNFYNTEWQRSDSSGCQGHSALFPSTVGSPGQRDTAAHTVLALLRAQVGPTANPRFNQIFTTRFAVPTALAAITPVDRSFSDSAAPAVGLILDDFDRPTGTSSAGGTNETSGVTVSHGTVGNRHESGQRGAAIAWTTASPGTYFQSNFAGTASGRDVSGYSFVNLRLARQNSPQNPATPALTQFKVLLVDASGTASAAVALSSYVRLTGPVGGPAGLHVLLQTAQIPLSAFGTVDLTRVRGVRLRFDDTTSGAIYVSNIRFSNSAVPATPAIALLSAGSDDDLTARAAADDGITHASAPHTTTSTLAPPDDIFFAGLRRSPQAALDPTGRAVAALEIELRSRGGFPVRNELPILRIGDRDLALSRYPDSGATDTLLFQIDATTLAATPDGVDLTLRYGDGPTAPAAPAGRLNKHLLRE